MSKHGVDRYQTESEYRAMVTLAWHDTTCPEGSSCSDRPEHAAEQDIASSGILERFLERLSSLETEMALDAV